MRHNRNYSYSGPTSTNIEVGETHVVVRDRSGTPKVAEILEVVKNDAGEVVNVLLDRLVHEKYSSFTGWNATGCFVTELTSKDW